MERPVIQRDAEIPGVSALSAETFIISVIMKRTVLKSLTCEIRNVRIVKA